MLGSAAIVAGGALGGGLIGASSQEKTNQANIDFATQMSNTQYQRAVADMKAAGLNPILAAGNGGAGTPSVQQQAPGATAGQGFANAARALALEVPKQQAEIADINAAKKLKEANTDVQRVAAKQADQSLRIDASQNSKDLARGGTTKQIAEDADTVLGKVYNWGKEKIVSASKAFESGAGNTHGGANSAKNVQGARSMTRPMDKR